MIICYTVPEIRHVTRVIVIFHFGLFFALLPHYQFEKLKLKNKRKTNPKILSFHTCVNKIMIKWCTVPEIRWARVRPMKRWMDGWKKWYIEVGASPKNIMQLHCGGNLNVFNETKVAPVAETLENIQITLPSYTNNTEKSGRMNKGTTCAIVKLYYSTVVQKYTCSLCNIIVSCLICVVWKVYFTSLHLSSSSWQIPFQFPMALFAIICHHYFLDYDFTSANQFSFWNSKYVWYDQAVLFSR